MKNKAFTLIELLVVVLIIGILAAIAVPQYRKAVDKAQITKIMPLVDAILKGQEMYFLTHGEYAFDLSKLDIDVSSNDCIIAGSRKHQIWCPGFVLNNGFSNGVLGGNVGLYFCPSQSDPSKWDTYMPCHNARELVVSFRYQHPYGLLQPEDVGKITCSSTTERGKYLKSMFCQ